VVVGDQGEGRISKYLFGANLLWADDAEGAFDPSTDSFYPGFVSMLRRLGLSALRYPGGTTSDSFHWERAVGPEQDRKANEPYGMQAAALSDICCVLDGPEPSTVGPDEFGRLLDEIGAVGTVTVNFATGTAKEAADFVAYMTAPQAKHPSSDPDQASYWAALRAKNSHPAPYDVPYWEVGNEQFFPGQYGWRSGKLVSLGPHAAPCPPGEAATCLYAFGGTTAFYDQAVGTFADEMPSASYSSGAPRQDFYVYFPPVVPGSATVYVAGQPWAEVASLSEAGPGARVYTLDPATGEISFGDGPHGLVPPKGAKITVSYQSGPHGGFVEFYRAMKAMNPHVDICESEGSNTAFLQFMGDEHPYDCIVLHEYARPADVLAPLGEYEERLMAFPEAEGADLARLQLAARRYSGRDVPVVLTEYGQLVAPVPAADPEFNLSLDEGLLIGAQLVEWADHGVPLAEKYLVDSAPFNPAHLTTVATPTERGGVGSTRPTRRGLRVTTRSVGVEGRGIDRLGDLGSEDLVDLGTRGRDATELSLAAVLHINRAVVATGLSVDSAMVAHEGSEFVTEPSGLVLALMSRLGGTELLPVATVDGPLMCSGARKAPVLWVTAGLSRTRELFLAAVDASPTTPVRAEVVLEDFGHARWLRAYVLDGPGPTAYNAASGPGEVRVEESSVKLSAGGFTWTFPAHSLTLLELPVAPRPSLALRSGGAAHRTPREQDGK
jgi:alpha-N-arabinofuranosidase